MSSGQSPPGNEIEQEILVLIETLHASEKRLEDLTGGEVDTVANRQGRTIVLRRAQDQLRQADAARQATILNALPAHIALLDAQANILSVNEAWRQFGEANAPPGPGHGIGVNYLQVCDNARGKGESDALKTAAGIRSVLSGEAVEFSLQYPCHAPSEQRWFQMAVTSLAAGDMHGVVVMHVDITERKLAADALQESERRFSDMLQNVQLISVMLDRESRITYCNDYLLQLTGWQRGEVMGRDWFEIFMPQELGDMKPALQALLANNPEAWHIDNEIFTRSRERRLIRWNNSVLRSVAGDVIGVASIGEDISERKESEERITYLNRVLAVLSGINALIVRTHDRDKFFEEACRVAVNAGGFRMSWIGMLDRSAMRIVPIASAGIDENHLKEVKGLYAAADGASLGNTRAGRVIGEKKAFISNDLRNDPKTVFGQHHTEYGIRSLAILPLIIADEAVGVLALYTGEVGFFEDDEIKLLSGMTGDIAFAIDHIDKEKRLDYLAYYDVLTGLANRTLFHERLEQGLVNAKAQDHKLALVLLDIQRFNAINDTLGRPAGDVLLKAVSDRLSGTDADAGRLGRIEADHFAVMIPEVKTEEDLAHLVERHMAELFDQPYRIGEADLSVSAKVGIAMFPADGSDANALFRSAEAALKKAKSSAEKYLFFTPGMNTRVAGRLTLENQLRHALDNEEFVLHYQPKANLTSRKMASAEALIRWNDPRTGLVPPAQFIPVLEETGLIYEVGRWALRRAVTDYLRWRHAGLAAVRIAVNVSSLQLRHRDFVAEIERTVEVDPHAAAGLELEITESLIMDDVQHSIGMLKAIRAMGLSIAIDDFGTGFSSLSYLAKLPVDTLKIDRSFVNDMTTGPDGLALVSTIINLAHSMRLTVVAEGVETEEQSRLLRLLGCDEMQGFLFSKPVPAEIFEEKYLAPQPAG